MSVSCPPLHARFIRYDAQRVSLPLTITLELGAHLAAEGIAVVYGGSRFGCLGKMADAVVAGGGKLTGILPPFFTGELK